MNIRTKVVGVVSRVSLVLLLAVLVAGLVSAAPPNVPPGLAHAIAAQERHTDALLAKAGVVGTAVGLAADGTPVVKVYTKSGGVRGLPADLDGVPVEEEETGEFVAQQGTWPGLGGSSGTERLIVYRGALYCTVGTMAMLLGDATNTYALSNAHVYANEGSKTSGTVVKGIVSGENNGDRILLPGRVDMEPDACGNQAQIDGAVIGHLWDYQSIVFSRTANNEIDAAIAKLSDAGKAKVANNTSDGFGTPSTQVATATVGLEVQKYGRTTGLTTSAVTGVNATVLIRYDKALARFIHQVVVGGPFSGSGDSGSLIMTVAGNHPVALLFAGSSSSTIGNPIQAVLARFGLAILGTTP